MDLPTISPSYITSHESIFTIASNDSKFLSQGSPSVTYKDHLVLSQRNMLASLYVWPDFMHQKPKTMLLWYLDSTSEHNLVSFPGSVGGAWVQG